MDWDILTALGSGYQAGKAVNDQKQKDAMLERLEKEKEQRMQQYKADDERRQHDEEAKRIKTTEMMPDGSGSYNVVGKNQYGEVVNTNAATPDQLRARDIQQKMDDASLQHTMLSNTELTDKHAANTQALGYQPSKDEADLARTRADTDYTKAKTGEISGAANMTTGEQVNLLLKDPSSAALIKQYTTGDAPLDMQKVLTLAQRSIDAAKWRASQPGAGPQDARSLFAAALQNEAKPPAPMSTPSDPATTDGQ